MIVQLTLNGELRQLFSAPDESLMTVLRRSGCWSVKHGCETGECGACSVLLDGKLVPTCILLAAQVDGRSIVTLEALSAGHDLHPIQQAFAETGAIQCGYCTPAMILATQALLDAEPRPTEAQAREALSSVLCRCTGYVKPVEAVLRAAALRRGEAVPPVESPTHGISIDSVFGPRHEAGPEPPEPVGGRGGVLTQPRVTVRPALDAALATEVVGHPETKVDAAKLAKGKPVFTDDFDLPGMLHAALLTSPHAHARIRRIDTSRARALPGVHAVLTYKDVPRVIYATGGQSYPNPPPWDQVSLDSKVRFVGDRVAVVAAETPQIAREALELIEVEYERLPAVFNPEEAMQPGAPMIHDEPDAVRIADANRNIAATVHATVGDFDRAFAESDRTFERTYYSHQVQQAAIEPHIAITYWDEDDRLVIRTATQVPFHVRRMIAPLIGLPVKRIRVIKPRIGGGFGGKQEMLIEDLCAHLTIATSRPVRFEFTRELEFTSSRSRHPQNVTYRAGVNKQPDGTVLLHALEMRIIEDAGAYGTHGLTVCTVSGLRGLSTYRCPNMHLDAKIVYTNRPVPGAFRGYGAPQAHWALESLMDEIAAAMNLNPVEFRLKNAVRAGDPLLLAKALGEGREGFEQTIQSCGLAECIGQAGAAIGWDRQSDPEWHVDPARPHVRRGLGMAACMQGTAIAGLDMGAASIKMNDDGSFNVLVGATDLGTGSDTVLAQIAAETLGVPLSDVIIYSSDTDFTPFDTGAYASSTTYISGGAVKKAAELVREQITERAMLMLHTGGAPGGRPDDREAHPHDGMILKDRRVFGPDGRSVSLGEVALHSLHTADQRQIMGTASHMSYESPPPFAAQYAEVEVDTETGQVTVKKLVMGVDCGTAINPQTSTGQIEGGMAQALGYAVCEEMVYDEAGRLLPRRFGDYRIFQADEMPELQAILVPTYEPSGPFGAKAVAEIPMDGVAPAVANAVFDAVRVRIRDLPLTPEKVWLALQTRDRGGVSVRNRN